jgi:hypothetical protein
MKKTFYVCLTAMSLLLASCAKESITAPENTPPVANQESTYTVSYEEALQTLLSTLEKIDSPATRGSVGKRTIANHYTVGQPIGEAVTRSTEDEYPDPYMHIFNFEGGEGYALVSGDKRTPPIFAITESGSMGADREVENPDIIMFLANAEKLYFSSIENYEEIPTTRATWSEYGDWQTMTYATKGKSFNDWGQYYPYGNLLSGSFAHNVQTTTAHIMAFHNYPSSYREDSTKPIYTFTWSTMTRHRPKGSYTYYSAAYDQIARLYQQIGLTKNLNVKYTSSGTEANAADIPRTLKNFGYSSGGTHGGYNETTVLNELRSGYIVAASGYGHKTVDKDRFLGIVVKTTTTYSNYRSWVMDGIIYRYRTKIDYRDYTITGTSVESQYLVRCNWGWDGADNGYYMSQAFDSYYGPITTRAEENPYYYQYKLEAVTGIRIP